MGGTGDAEEKKWREGRWRLVSPLFIILFLHVIAFFFFTCGFLLTRTELSFTSNCSDVFEVSYRQPCARSHQSSDLTDGDPEISRRNSSQNKCWTRPAVDRIVIIVLDALRFDFVAPSTFFEEKRPWMDKLKVLQKMASDDGSGARIFKSLADPPTTSLQRLKGLTTGGLPTFIDVGNSFGAPAITEDNLIYQLMKNGKRVMMMGDDTWLQLFPTHFHTAYPFPSFNVKDLDTVDNGVIQHLFPALYRNDWDVLIAHFLGVDHAGHIFGVDSNPMFEKLEAYNGVLEGVIDILKNHSEPGDLHENTLLLVMGDHGQTVNGDHGGGTPEEVETSLFAMSARKPPEFIPTQLDDASCRFDVAGNTVCISSIQQLDFAVTIAALVGIPFPYGSLGCINPELYALSSGTWYDWRNPATRSNSFNLVTWMQHYLSALQINSWQVKRYIDQYSASSLWGFPSEDLLKLEELYSQAQSKWPLQKEHLLKDKSLDEGCSDMDALLDQVQAHTHFLRHVADLARSKWTQFDGKMMNAGIFLLLVSVAVHIVAIHWVKTSNLYAHAKNYFSFWETTSDLVAYNGSYSFLNAVGISERSTFAAVVVLTRGVSLLSNSYILTEGKVAHFLLAATGVFNLQCAIAHDALKTEAFAFLILNFVLRVIGESGLSKHMTPSYSDVTNLSVLEVEWWEYFWLLGLQIVPIVVIVTSVFLIFQKKVNSVHWKTVKYCLLALTTLNYVLMLVYWALEGNLYMSSMLKYVEKNAFPRIVYALSFGMVIFLAFSQKCGQTFRHSDDVGGFLVATVTMLLSWSSSIFMLIGKQGPFVAMLSIFQGWCIIKLQRLTLKHEGVGAKAVRWSFDSLAVAQWNLLAVSLFFCLGHWCAFDGLHYGAAFVGFEEFHIVRQGILLTIETFGFSNILPILGLPLLALFQCFSSEDIKDKKPFFVNLIQVLLTYGLVTATTTTFTTFCVAIQRRHLMVWGLFAPKYVFDVVSLILTDIFICLTSLYYI